MWSLKGTKEGSEEEANQLWGDPKGTCRKFSKGLPVGNAFLLCLILYQNLCFFSFLERGILKNTFGLKQKQKRWNSGETSYSQK